MSELRYINLGSVEPKYVAALQEYSRVCTIDVPTVIFCRLNKLSIEVNNFYPADYYLHLDKIPADIEIQRFYLPGLKAGAFLAGPGVREIYLHTPANYSANTTLLLTKSILEVLKLAGVNCHSQGNDCYFTLGGKVKKFAGSIPTTDWGSGQTVGGVTVTFETSVALMRQFYDFSSPLFTKKLPFEDIGDIVGGLKEVAPMLDEEAFIRQVVQEYASRLDLTILEDSLNDSETNKLTQLANDIDSDDWRFNVTRPDLGNLREEP